jgi:hypothetical protein
MICDVGDLRPGTPARISAANARSAPATHRPCRSLFLRYSLADGARPLGTCLFCAGNSLETLVKCGFETRLHVAAPITSSVVSKLVRHANRRETGIPLKVLSESDDSAGGPSRFSPLLRGELEKTVPQPVVSLPAQSETVGDRWRPPGREHPLEMECN